MKRFLLLIFSFIALFPFPMDSRAGEPLFYGAVPVPFTRVKITDTFWESRIRTNREVTIPYAFKKCEDTGRIRNFKVAGGLEESDRFPNRGFDDSDVFKIMEGAAYSLAMYPDPELESYLDTLIGYVGKAQQKDGYIYTVRTMLQDQVHRDLLAPEFSRVEIGSHELYNVGHMYEAAVAHYMATGKRSFLDIALKNAHLVDSLFGWDKMEKYPGHQEIELALIKLYHTTGEERFLDLSEFFLEVRDNGSNPRKYFQSHAGITEEKEAVGHAVRALYMYSSMADVAAHTGNHVWLHTLDALWNDIVGRKLYITGGVGPGSGHGEGFGTPYFLPNEKAYCETCAAIANAFWNHRMFLLHKEAKYMDVFERSLYNNVISGISLKGDRFFYPNRLESKGDVERREWFSVSCCPSNLSRFIPSVPGYIYALDEDGVYVNLFISSETSLEVKETSVILKQQSEVPWGGRVTFTLLPEKPTSFACRIRIPGWASDRPVPSDLYEFTSPAKGELSIKVNGKKTGFMQVNGYAVLEREWNKNDQIEVSFPYEVREIEAHPEVEENIGKKALQAGPIVYCLESHDNPGADVLELVYPENKHHKLTFRDNLLGGVMTIEGRALAPEKNENESGSYKPVKFTAIPYYGWANRDKGKMRVWLPAETK